MLGLFFNTLTADEKYSLLYRDNLTQPIQMQLSKKLKSFSELFSAVLNSRLNFELFKKKITLIVCVFPKLKTANDVVRQMSKESRFRRSFDKKFGSWSQILLKSEHQHLYHIYWSLWRQFI